MEVMRCWWLARASERQELVAVRSCTYRGMQSKMFIMARHRLSRPLCSQRDESVYSVSTSYQIAVVHSDPSYLLPEICDIGLQRLADLCPSIHLSMCSTDACQPRVWLPRVWRGQVWRGAAHFASFKGISISTSRLARSISRPPEWRQDPGTTAGRA